MKKISALGRVKGLERRIKSFVSKIMQKGFKRIHGCMNQDGTFLWKPDGEHFNLKMHHTFSRKHGKDI